MPLKIVRGGDRSPEGENLIQADEVDLAPDLRMDEERLDLRGEQELVPRLGIEERPHPHPVARGKQLFPLVIPDGERPLAVELFDAVLAPFLVSVEDDFCITP